MHDLERVLKAMADLTRLRIINILNRKKACVCELSRILGISGPSVSRHIKKLLAAGLIGCEQDGFWTNYYLRRPGSKSAGALVFCVGRALTGNRTLKGDLDKLRHIDRRKLCYVRTRRRK